MQMNTTTKPMGACGILHILKDAEMRFHRASKQWENGVVPTITQTEYIDVRCPYCDETGMRYVGTSGDHQQYGPMLYSKCPTCDGTRVSERHPFPKQIVKLARLLANQSELTIARTLAGLLMGFKEGK